MQPIQAASLSVRAVGVCVCVCPFVVFFFFCVVFFRKSHAFTACACACVLCASVCAAKCIIVRPRSPCSPCCAYSFGSLACYLGFDAVVAVVQSHTRACVFVCGKISTKIMNEFISCERVPSLYTYTGRTRRRYGHGRITCQTTSHQHARATATVHKYTSRHDSARYFVYK